MDNNLSVKILESYMDIDKIHDDINNKIFQFITKASELVELSEDMYQIERTIKKCVEAGVTCSICGQAGSVPHIVEKLVGFGITSVSSNADAVAEVRKTVARAEKKIILDAARKSQE